MAFTALDVKKLREMTNVGMMDCKKALQATDGDMDAAVDWLREKGLAKAAKKADRVAAEGVAYAAVVNGIGVVIEVNSETDFAAKTDAFMDLVKNLATVVATENPADVDALKACKYPGSNLTVTEIMQEKVMSIGENMQIRRFARFADNTSVAYVHAGRHRDRQERRHADRCYEPQVLGQVSGAAGRRGQGAGRAGRSDGQRPQDGFQARRREGKDRCRQDGRFLQGELPAAAGIRPLRPL